MIKKTYKKLSCIIFVLLVVSMPFVAAASENNKCMKINECSKMAKQLRKEFADNAAKIKNLEKIEHKLEKEFDKKKAMYTGVKKAMIKNELLQLHSAIVEAKDWHNAFMNDYKTAYMHVDINELGDLLFCISDLNEPIDKAEGNIKKLQELL